MKTHHQVSHRSVFFSPLAGRAGLAMQEWRVDNRVGESPFWHGGLDRLVWIDVRAPALLALCPRTGLLAQWRMPTPIGAARPAGADAIVIALKDELRVFQPSTNQSWPIARPEPERHSNRLNEACVSPCGQWLIFGSMSDVPEKAATGAIYAMDGQGHVRRIHDGLVIANGFGFSPDGSEFFFSDSHRGLVYRGRWDRVDAQLHGVAVWAMSNEQQGRPDGAMVDAQGCYWSAGVSAGCINVFAADGGKLRSIPLPCQAPTMPCRAPDGTVWVTSLVRAEWPAGRATAHDGQLFELSFATPPVVPASPVFALDQTCFR